MTDQTSFRRIAALSAIAAALCIIGSIIVLSVATDFNFDLLSNPVDLINLDADAAAVFRWGSILELFGYFLFLIPVVLFLWRWLSPQSPNLVGMYTLFGLGAVFTGILEEALRISFLPPMMAAYPTGVEAQNEVLLVVFQSVIDFNFESLYAVVSILGGLWWLGVGLVMRSSRRILGIATVILGIAVLVAGLGWLLRVGPLARLELFYFFEPFWAVWLAVVIWRGTRENEVELEPGG